MPAVPEASVNQQPQDAQTGQNELLQDFIAPQDTHVFPESGGEGFLPPQTHGGPSSTTMPGGPPPVFRHIQSLTGKQIDDSDSSDEEQDSLSFTLTQEEVLQIASHEFVDFDAIYRHHQRSPYGIGEQEASSTGGAKRDMSVKEWAWIFMAFQAKHARWHPKEATALALLR